MGKFGIVAVLLLVVGAIAIYEASAASMKSVVGAGDGLSFLPWCGVTEEELSSIGFSAARSGNTVTGTANILVISNNVIGQINGGNIADASRYRLTGEIGGSCETEVAFEVSGLCGNDVVISYTDERGGTGTFNGDVVCTFK